MPRIYKIVTCTIPTNAQQSDTQDLEGAQLATIIMPASWTTADLTIKVGLRSNDMKDLFDDAGASKFMKVAAGRAVSLSGSALAGFRYIAVVSSVSQVAARALTLVGLR